MLGKLVTATVAASVLLATIATSTVTASPAHADNYCGFVPGTTGLGGHSPYYVHCDANTRVWVRVLVAASEDYDLCAGPGQNVLHSLAHYAYYKGALC
ncbi:DUF6355 family natural product biosynthesis protein [Nonomuraea guangzhouensis]|uniref:DUF6355 family natural product biosynthesis protein n=1 Tax=Nonomuraea guangzhouensis TaxID=1291555 RepID=A0ABW4G2B9_9ACTN|nr:DUF6355 family natural product biosynthesis protein [Nonomuraea guangzhouensis]